MYTFFAAVLVTVGLLFGSAGVDPEVEMDKQSTLGTQGGRCPKIYAPVICDNGKTYPNQCVADQHHAENCVPTGDI